jgi:hypothetical protein
MTWIESRITQVSNRLKFGCEHGKVDKKRVFRYTKTIILWVKDLKVIENLLFKLVWFFFFMMTSIVVLNTQT